MAPFVGKAGAALTAWVLLYGSLSSSTVFFEIVIAMPGCGSQLGAIPLITLHDLLALRVEFLSLDFRFTFYVFSQNYYL